MSGAKHRRKGDRCEREIVARHRKLGIRAERYPASGATRFRGSGHDVDLYPFGSDEEPITAEVKARKDGAGFATLEKWLGDYDALFLKRNNAEPLVIVPWNIWARFIVTVAQSPSKQRETDANDQTAQD
jgi:Holliday junction resolvase